MKKEVFDEMNEHINFEYYSAFIYLRLAIAMEKANYKGYSSWLMDHYKEEIEHAEDFISFMIARDQSPVLLDIKMEDYDIDDPLEVAKIIYDHERKVTERIYKLHDICKKADDYATEIFMHKYIREQIEEEDITKDIVDRFTIAGDDVAARLIVDEKLEVTEA